MNRIFKRVFNKSLGMYVVASEHAKSNTKSGTTGTIKKVVGAIALATAVVSPLGANAAGNLPFQQGKYLNSSSQSYLEKSDFYAGNSWSNYDANYSNLNFWESLSQMKDQFGTINVTDYNLAPSTGNSYYGGNISQIHGNKNTLISPHSNTYENYNGRVFVQGSNNVSIDSSYSTSTTLGNNNTRVGYAEESTGSVAGINTILSKYQKFGSLSRDQLDLLLDNRANEFAESLLSQGYTLYDLEQVGIYQEQDWETEEYYWYISGSRAYDFLYADLQYTGTIGFANNTFGNESIAHGNQNNIVADDVFAGGDNNTILSRYSAVLDGDNNVIAGATTLLDKGSNNIIVAAKNTESSKYSYNSTYIRDEVEATSVSEKESLGDYKPIYEANGYSGNFEYDYKRLIEYFTTNYSEYEYQAGAVAIHDRESFLLLREKLFNHYGYSVGEANNSILIGSDGLFNAEDSIAIGHGTITAGKNSIALGANSVTTEDNTISGGDRKLTSVNDGADGTDLVNVRQVRAWSDYMTNQLGTHFNYVDSIKEGGSRYGQVKDITAEEVMVKIQDHVDAGSEAVRKDLIDNKLDKEVQRAETEILAGLEIAKEREVAKAENAITLNAAQQAMLGKELSNTVFSTDTVLAEVKTELDTKVTEFGENGEKLISERLDNALNQGTKSITDLYDFAKSDLGNMLNGKINIQNAKDGAVADDIEHTNAINKLITDSFNKEDGAPVGLSAEEQAIISSNIQNNALEKHDQIQTDFNNYAIGKLTQFADSLKSYATQAKEKALSTFDLLAKAQDQEMLTNVGNQADAKDVEWAQLAYSHAEKEIEASQTLILNQATAQDQVVLDKAIAFSDAEDLKLTQKGLESINSKDLEVVNKLNQSIQDGDEAVLNTALNLAEQLDLQIQNDLIQTAKENNDDLLTSLKATANAGDKVMFDKFDEFLSEAEKADEAKIAIDIAEADAVVRENITTYVDQRDADTLNDAKDYIDQRYGALNDQMIESEKVINASIASSLAASSVPTSTRAGRGLIGFGTGHYGGQSAVALGASAMSTSKRWAFGVNTSLDTQYNNSGSVSFSYYWK